MVHDLNPKHLQINGIFFCKIRKSLFLWSFWALSPKMRFFSKNSAPSVFYPSDNLTLWEVSEKSYESFWRKCLYLLTYWHTDILTYWQWWNHRTPFHLKAGVQKVCLYCWRICKNKISVPMTKLNGLQT